MVVQVAFLGVLIIAAWFYLLLWEHAAEQALGVRALMVDLDLVNLSISLNIGRWANDLLGTLTQLE